MRVFLNLCAGLDEISHPYRVNDYRHAKRNPGELCCILGKRHVLDHYDWPNPLLVGPCIHDHPVSDPDLLQRRCVKRILVPGEWMRCMCENDWRDRVFAWPVGIETRHWTESSEPKTLDFLLYNKIRWRHAEQESALLEPIRAELKRRNLSFTEIKYGSYAPENYRTLLHSSRAMIFICEHETQGIAYQEALASGVPILAWDHQGAWTDPEYFPHRVSYSPVSSVPYWDDRCGLRFRNATEFAETLAKFLPLVHNGRLAPRSYILDQLTLAKCAAAFVEHAHAAMAGDSTASL